MTFNTTGRSALLTFGVDDGTVRLRSAVRQDLPDILALLADDQLGSAREGAADLAPYEKAFDAIDADPSHLLLVGELAPERGGEFRVVAFYERLGFAASHEGMKLRL